MKDKHTIGSLLLHLFVPDLIECFQFNYWLTWEMQFNYWLRSRHCRGAESTQAAASSLSLHPPHQPEQAYSKPWELSNSMECSAPVRALSRQSLLAPLPSHLPAATSVAHAEITPCPRQVSR